MRGICFFLISATLFFLVQASGAESVKTPSLFQARGLQKDHCYREMASLVCNSSCNLTLLPLTQGQVALNIQEISEHDRKLLGHFFQVKFKVLNQRADQIKILLVSQVSDRAFKANIEKSSGLFVPINCKK